MASEIPKRFLEKQREGIGIPLSFDDRKGDFPLGDFFYRKGGIDVLRNIEVSNAEQAKARPILICGDHRSDLDGFVLLHEGIRVSDREGIELVGVGIKIGVLLDIDAIPGFRAGVGVWGARREGHPIAG